MTGSTTPSVPRSGALGPVLLLALVGILCYGLLIPELGFYWDDWFFAWVGSSQGGAGLVESLAIDRPGSGVLFAANHSLLGGNRLAWHVYLFLVRLAGALLLWCLCRQVWPRERGAAGAVAALFLVYPGFSQQAITIGYQNYHYSVTLALLSLVLMVRALDGKGASTRLTFLGLALITELAYLFILDNHIGFEVVRLGILFAVLERLQEPTASPVRRLAGFLRVASPYLVTMLGFLVWRVLLFSGERQGMSVSEALGHWTANPMHAFIHIPSTLFDDCLDSLLLAWVAPWIELRALPGSSPWLSLVPACLAGVVFLLLLARGARQEPRAANRGWARQMAVVGAVSLLPALLIPVLTLRSITLLSESDRWAYAPGVSVCLLLVGGLRLLPRRWPRNALLTGLVVVAVSTHFMNAQRYRDDWKLQRSIWWQLAWRAPDIEDGSTVVLLAPELMGVRNYTIWCPMNLIYGPEHRSPKLFGCHSTTERLKASWAWASMTGRQATPRLPRNVRPQVDYSKRVVLFYDKRGEILHVVDPRRLEELPVALEQVARYSDPSLIQVRGVGPAPPREVFGEEPERPWSWYFQKAQLARQRGDHPRIVELAREAARAGRSPRKPLEWLVFVEAHIRTGHHSEASRLIRNMIALEDNLADRHLTPWLERLTRELGGESAQRQFLMDLRASLEAEPVGHR